MNVKPEFMFPFPIQLIQYYQFDINIRQGISRWIHFSQYNIIPLRNEVPSTTMMKSPTDNNQRPNIINLKSPAGNGITEKQMHSSLFSGRKMKSIVYGHECLGRLGCKVVVVEESFTTLLSLIFGIKFRLISTVWNWNFILKLIAI